MAKNHTHTKWLFCKTEENIGLLIYAIDLVSPNFNDYSSNFICLFSMIVGNNATP